MALAREALKQLFRKPATSRYPFEKPVLPEGFRGRPVWNMTKCIGCGLCSWICPSSAIEMIGKGLTAEIVHHVDRCMFCAQCVETCPKQAIRMSKEFELAAFDLSKMIHRYRRRRPSKEAQDVT